MFWEELFLRRAATDADLARALAETFGVAPDAVQVTGSVASIASRFASDVPLLVERGPTRGDFRQRVRVYVRDPAAEELIRRRGDLALVQQFCAAVGVDCLVSDDSPSSESWLLLREGTTPLPVILDGERLEHAELVLTDHKAARAS